ncbi:hypothetical protein MK489_24040, partial [Myxococcota bacterium]|nr:hypothetical protein [Myxococcota bacterium]
MHPDEHEAVAGAAMLYRGPTGLTFNKGGALYPRTAWLVDQSVRSLWELPEVLRVQGGQRYWTGAVPMLRVLRGLNVVLALVTAALL